MSVSNEKIYEAVMALREDIGSLKSSTLNNHEFTKAVSSKADRIDQKLDAHSNNQDAHGAGGERRVKGSTLAWVGALFAVLDVVGHFLGGAVSARHP